MKVNVRHARDCCEIATRAGSDWIFVSARATCRRNSKHSKPGAEQQLSRRPVRKEAFGASPPEAGSLDLCAGATFLRTMPLAS